MIRRTKWVCPHCSELSPTRHWSISRHIHRKHDGIGEPISINTHQTRTQMNMGSERSKYKNPPYHPRQLDPKTNNPSNLYKYQNIPSGSFSRSAPISKSNESGSEYAELKPDSLKKVITQKLYDSLGPNIVSKLQDARTLAQSCPNPQLVDLTLTNLSLLVLNNPKLEYLVDEILVDLRSVSNFASMGAKEVPLRNHRVGYMPDAAVSKLAEIETKLKPRYHEAALWEVIEDLIRKFNETQNYSILDAALENYK